MKAKRRYPALSMPLIGCITWVIMNCAKACPKGLNPAKAIAQIKRMMVERQM